MRDWRARETAGPHEEKYFRFSSHKLSAWVYTTGHLCISYHEGVHAIGPGLHTIKLPNTTD